MVDRIAEAYPRPQDHPIVLEEARDRAGWITACAQGPRVLKIGCREPILAVLLARAGHHIVAVDLDPAAIAPAHKLATQEPAIVRERIELRVADAMSAEFGERTFDTVVIGEVLAQLTDPSALLERAAALLTPGGRLVLTTPFGYLPHRDHSQEFRTSGLVSLLNARFVIDELAIVDGYFRICAHAITAPVVRHRLAPDVHELLLVTEEAAISAQRQLISQLARNNGQPASSIDTELLESEGVLAEKILRLERQLEHQKRVTATTQSRMRQAQLELKSLRKGLRQELGRAVEKSLTSPLGIIRLPSRILKAYRRARRRAEAGRLDPSSPDERLAGVAPAVIGSKTASRPERALPHRDISSAFPPYAFPDRRPRYPVRVATILDEFSDSSFRYEAELVRLRKETWREQLERERPEFMLVESAWRGNNGNWRGLITKADLTANNPLDALVRRCRSLGIPTVFWNKEDPPNFERFIDAAAKFDYVFTTDAHCLDRYHARLGHRRVAALPFAAQPAIHNPVGKVESDDHQIAFAGTWYGQKHEERGALLPILLDAAKGHNLHIFDRMSAHTDNGSYRFPDEYAPFLRSALAYPNVLSAYRSFKVFLNVNSVTDSPTMFARRVFEILASSTAVVSTASAGIERMLGDVVSVVHDEDEARHELNRLLSDSAYRQRKAHLGYRRVMREHSCASRFRTIAAAIGCDLEEERDAPTVAVITPVGDAGWLDNALGNVRRQHYKGIEPIWVLEDGSAGQLSERITRADPRATVVEVATGTSWEAMLRRGIEAARSPLIAAFAAHDLYGPEFLGDLALALTYTDAEIVGKAAHFTAAGLGEAPVLNEAASAYRYVGRLLGTAWLARRTVFERAGFDHLIGVEDGHPTIAQANGSGKIYGADPWNYLRLEHSGTTPVATASSLELGRLSDGRLSKVMI